MMRRRLKEVNSQARCRPKASEQLKIPQASEVLKIPGPPR